MPSGRLVLNRFIDFLLAFQSHDIKVTNCVVFLNLKVPFNL